MPGLGVRCVRDEPWVTGAETCELALALDAIGDRERALELFAGIQHLRDADGAYWTGLQFANQAHFPAERSNWTAAAIILAADALAGTTGGGAPVPPGGRGPGRRSAAGRRRVRMPGRLTRPGPLSRCRGRCVSGLAANPRRSPR